MNEDLLSDLTQAMAEYRFRQVADLTEISDATLLLKRQTWNTNRAIIVVSPAKPPLDIHNYLKHVRSKVAFRCGFFPFFWGIGIQVVMVSPGVSQSGIEPSQHVARIDNQWAIIQSVFLVDPTANSFRSSRSLGQFITGQFQDAIAMTLTRHFHSVEQ